MSCIEHVHFMISVWAKFYPTTDNSASSMRRASCIARTSSSGRRIGSGRLLELALDPYSGEAREIFWRQIETKLKPIGVDGRWLDNTEPDIHSNLDRESLLERMGLTAIGPAAQYFNTYARKWRRPVRRRAQEQNVGYLGAVSAGAQESKCASAGAQEQPPDKRVYILTRSGTAGMQRYAASIWSGDIAARWDDLYRQIAAGTNMSMSGSAGTGRSTSAASRSSRVTPNRRRKISRSGAS